MSFCNELKATLSAITPHECCRFAEMYGIFTYGGDFLPDSMCFSVNCADTAECIIKWLKRDFSIFSRLTVSGKKHTVTVESAADRRKLINHFSKNTAFLKRECCRSAYLRGVFLASGLMNDPEKDYRLEFSTRSAALCSDLEAFLTDCRFEPKKTVRGKSYVLYFRNSRQIEDILTFIDAGNYALELMGVKIYKDMSNKVNRQRNCDDANSTKIVSAAQNQVQAIKKLKRIKKFNSLPEELRLAAKLRLENPEASLGELCELSEIPITRSGLNHRLQKMIELAKQG